MRPQPICFLEAAGRCLEFVPGLTHFHSSLQSLTRSARSTSSDLLPLSLPGAKLMRWCIAPDRSKRQPSRTDWSMSRASEIHATRLHPGKCSLRGALPFTLKLTARGLMKPVKHDRTERLAAFCWKLKRWRCMREAWSRDFLPSTDPVALCSCASFWPAKQFWKEKAHAGSIKFTATMPPERSSNLSNGARDQESTT